MYNVAGDGAASITLQLVQYCPKYLFIKQSLFLSKQISRKMPGIYMYVYKLHDSGITSEHMLLAY